MEGLQDARHGFLGACEALLSLGDDETRAQGLVRDAAAACALFCTFATSLRTDVSLVPSSGECAFPGWISGQGSNLTPWMGYMQLAASSIGVDVARVYAGESRVPGLRR